MGSGTKKHKKERDSRKHKHNSRSTSVEESPDHRSRERERHSRRHHRHHKHRSKSQSRSRSRTPIKVSIEFRGKERIKRHVHHKKHKESRSRHRSDESPEKIEIYHSDSSDVIEVPLAPPAPQITNEKSKSKSRSRSRSKPKQILKSKSRSKSPSPLPENGAGDCLSIVETNKLRAKLGLKPLEVDATQGVSKEIEKKSKEEGLLSFKDEWGEFLHKPADNLATKAEAEKIREKLKQKKEKRALEDKLKRVRTLGESDEEVDNVQKWLERSKKKDELRKEADKRAKMLEEMDAEFGVTDLIQQDVRNAKRDAYKDRDLKGLRVEHDVGEFTEGKTIILTLKDKDVLDEKEDALVNVNLIDQERYKKNVENKKLRPELYGYDVYEEAYDEFGEPVDRSILSKYDEELMGEQKKKAFMIGENLEEERAHRRKLLEIKSKLAGKKLETLDDTKLTMASDVYTEAELEKFKKPKKKIKRLRQKLKPDDLLPLADGRTSNTRDLGRRTNHHGGGLVTDDVPEMKEDLSNMKVEEEDAMDLERVLSKARKIKQKEAIIRKALPLDPDEIKNEIKPEPDSDEEMNSVPKDGHIILNATAEFCRTLGDIPTYGMAGNRDEDSNDMMDFEQKPLNTEPPPEEAEPTTGTWNSVNPDAVVRPVNDDNSNDVSDVAILDEEPDVGAGVAAALRLAMSKGYLEKDDKNRPSNSRMAHLQAKNYSIEDKTYGEDDKFGRRDRYHTGPIMDFREKETFKPNVKLEYIDDGGRVLNAKEAFRYLSHKFHGKGPGKNKIEKRLKKNEQEGLMMKMSSTDTPLGTLNMLQQKQKETQSPFIVLSGNKQTHVGTSISKHK